MGRNDCFRPSKPPDKFFFPAPHKGHWLGSVCTHVLCEGSHTRETQVGDGGGRICLKVKRRRRATGPPATPVPSVAVPGSTPRTVPDHRIAIPIPSPQGRVPTLQPVFSNCRHLYTSIRAPQPGHVVVWRTSKKVVKLLSTLLQGKVCFLSKPTSKSHDLFCFFSIFFGACGCSSTFCMKHEE